VPADVPVANAPPDDPSWADARLSATSTNDGVPAEDGIRVVTLDRTEPGEPANGDGAGAARTTGRSVRRALVVGLVTGAIAALVAPLWAALGVAGVVAVGLHVRWVRGLATVGGVGLIAAGCASVVYGQGAHHYLPGSNWPSSFTNAGDLIWLGVVLLLADAAISAFRLRLPRPLASRALEATGPAPEEPPDDASVRESESEDDGLS
jgi:hypothetical protein